MPADQGEQSQKASVSKVPSRGSRDHDEPETAVGSGGGGGSSAWLRSFTCFTNTSDDDQVALDLSGMSSFFIPIRCVQYMPLVKGFLMTLCS